jgi:hypothetical protein
MKSHNEHPRFVKATITSNTAFMAACQPAQPHIQPSARLQRIQVLDSRVLIGLHLQTSKCVPE